MKKLEALKFLIRSVAGVVATSANYAWLMTKIKWKIFLSERR